MSDLKAVATVSEMARLVGLSRSRFHQLIGSSFPWPLYNLDTQRPFYSEELQEVCLDVRRRNFGVDGRAVMFYASRRKKRTTGRTTKTSKKASVKQSDAMITELADGLRSLGIMDAKPKQIEWAIHAEFPDGIGGLDQSEMLRRVFLQIRSSQKSTDNVE